MKALGLAAGLIGILVLVTITISTAIYMRNTRSNRITPAHRIIRRRRRGQQGWNFHFRMPFRKPESLDSFLTHDIERDVKSEGPYKHPPPPRAPPGVPPSAPALPPPPPWMSEKRRAVPTISGSLSSGSSSSSQRSISSEDTNVLANKAKQSNISSALVSELKKKLEQKIMEANKGYYC